MKQTTPLFVRIAAVVPLLVGGVALWVWATIPAAPDPGSLPSRVLEPPSAAYLEAVEEGRLIARDLLAEEKLPGLSLAVAVDGEIVWAEGFRYADMESRTPMTPATLLRIGGVSTALTATAVGLLVDRGRLDLDAPIQSYLPDVPEQQWPISARDLMSHTAGIRHHRGEGELFRKAGCTDDRERLAIFVDDALRFPPGTEYRYSAYGWVLVGAIVAAVAGEPYLDFVEREVLAPLRMNSTVADVFDRIETGSAHFYYPRMALDPSYGLQDAPTVDLSCTLPADGFLSTPSDLVRLASAMSGVALLDAATVEDLLTPVTLATGESTTHALGWTIQSVPLGAVATPARIVSQGLGEIVGRGLLSATAVGGQVSGGTAALVILPEHGIAVAVASNVSAAENVPVISLRLAEAFVRLSAAR